ncbi:carboxylesterase family protein [Nocardia abscessus]|uniref:carboxylesterase family protein n=1 Tax=Nocardia abscessus TaxID=120957 RepID=UPI001893A564|nr:carboxylesterase family protein [Nocardia abscessus]MBF6339326.1 carboxylesterase family protein [Nocardia abscessus]
MSDETWEVPTRCGRAAGAVRDRGGAFLGVPYAAPPTGQRCFGLPVAPAPWAGVRRADEFGPTPPRAAGGLRDRMPAGDPGPIGGDRHRFHELAHGRGPGAAATRSAAPGHCRSSRPAAGRRVDSNGIVMVCRTGGWNSSRMRMTRNG